MRQPHDPVRVLVVDDSSVIRSLLCRHLKQFPGITVVGSATDPFDAHDKIRALSPDVLTLDIEMPKMDGLTFLGILMERRPLPVIIISSISTEGSRQALEALRRGAVDVVAKPSGPSELHEMLDELPAKVIAAGNARVRAQPQTNRSSMSIAGNSVATLAPVPWRNEDPERIILLGASTGGTEALAFILERLPADVPPILIVQHIPAHFSSAFAQRLNDRCTIEIAQASDGDTIRPGRALVAPGDSHMSVVIDPFQGRKVKLDNGPKICFHRPSVDRLFSSAVPIANHIVAGIMTGMGRDGAEGLAQLHNGGARTFGQDASSCVVFGMSRIAHELGACDALIPLDRFPQALLSPLSSV